MHAAPAARYPVERSRAALALLAAGWAAGAITTLWWALQAAAPGWRQGMAAAVLLAVGAFGLRTWLRAPRGTIAWDGAAWTLAPERGQGGPGRVEPGVDLQWLLLLRWRPESGPAGWLWLERRHAPGAWAALRRAVYSRARTEAPQGQPPVASP
jgi:hypothetical protein